MKLKKQIKQILSILAVLMISFNIIGASSEEFPKELKISVSKNDIYQIEYVNFDISSRKMNVKGRNETVYCLEIDKDYPGNQTFKLQGSLDKKLSAIIDCGYPNRSAKDLNLSDDDQAYFATQTAIWTYLEGYNLNKMRGNKKVINAIKQIYNDGMKQAYSSNNEYKTYKISDKSIQEAIVIFNKKGTTEKPVVPETPSMPEKPETPETKPEIPETAEKPTVPQTTPEVPETPENPTVPQTTPEVPETPEKPTIPETTPEVPETPEKPTVPQSTPEVPEKPSTPPDTSKPIDGGENKVETEEPEYPPQEG